MKNLILGGVSAVLSFFIYLLGGLDIALECLLIAIVVDYISGMIKAYTTKTLSSRIGYKGILKKVGIIAIVTLSVLLDRITGEHGAIRTLVIYYFVANEGLSILENLAAAGVPVPEVISNTLQNLKNKKEGK